VQGIDGCSRGVDQLIKKNTMNAENATTWDKTAWDKTVPDQQPNCFRLQPLGLDFPNASPHHAFASN